MSIKNHEMVPTSDFIAYYRRINADKIGSFFRLETIVYNTIISRWKDIIRGSLVNKSTI